MILYTGCLRKIVVDFGNRLARLGGCNRYGFFRRGEEALRTETKLYLVIYF